MTSKLLLPLVKGCKTFSFVFNGQKKKAEETEKKTTKRKGKGDEKRRLII